MKFKKRTAGGVANAYPGNGTLTSYKTRADSWILNQLDTKTVSPAIQIDETDGENFRFSAIKRKVASIITSSSENITIVRKAKKILNNEVNDYRYSLIWELHGAIEGSSINEVISVKDFLMAKIDTDLQTLNFNFEWCIDATTDAKIDFANRFMYCENRVSFDSGVITDSAKLEEVLKAIGFLFEDVV